MYLKRWVGVVMMAVSLSGWTAGQNSPLYLPRCCPINFSISTLAANDTCLHTPTIEFAPPVIINTTTIIPAMNIANDEGTDLPCDSYKYVQINDKDTFMMLMKNDVIKLFWFPPNGHSYQMTENYCVGTMASESPQPVYVAKVCYEDPVIQMKKDIQACSKTTCVRKCCPPGEHIWNRMYCTPTDNSTDWQQRFPATVSPKVHMVYGYPVCEKFLIYKHDQYTLMETGEVLATEVFSQEEYCIENNQDLATEQVEQIANICYKESLVWECPWKEEILIPVLMSLSCICLAFTWIVYIVVPELRKRNTDRCLLSLISTMIAAFITIMVNKSSREVFSGVQCTITALIMLMTVLAIFFWLNVMSYHIYSRVCDHREGNRVFLLYSLYAWGCPFLVTLVAFIIDLTQVDFIRPKFELPNCWFSDEHSRWLYQYGIMLVLLIINLAFFVRSVVILVRRQRYKLGSDSNKHTLSAWLYAKLFIVIGGVWITEVIAWQTMNHCSVLTTILDSINSLQGVYIFLVAICFRRDLKVFHCGWPYLLTAVEGKSTSDQGGDVTEIMNKVS
ncbi:G-protein coupled receptor Mth-like 3-like [Homarus americanus]|uniref:G-protein coupled receptor Mth-like 3-like n=1 Tax=Homarus americanus TaxID=6706 RepID=A0A8J5K331_HOMAM|nr:G-protein coupled receptor Mth-like 3-like [Homarus americanus]